jgi:histidinol-phosphate phosphatase family protein
MKKAAFLDRDGVLNRKAPEGQYVTRWEEMEFLPGAREAVRLLNQAGYFVVVVSNQRCVAKGLITTPELDSLHARMRLEFEAAGARIDAIYCCPHDSRPVCSCRKPQPGMLLEAARAHQIDLPASWMIGDSEHDVEAGGSAGCRTARLVEDSESPIGKANVFASSLLEAVQALLETNVMDLKQVQMPRPIAATGQDKGEVSLGRPALKYRADIDGLRAVAVLSVLAFHIGLSIVPGGFVGVDVFFVISGYLISSIVFSEIAASRFSVIGFYERRIRRIFPALFAMLAVCSVFASIYLLPTELVAYSKSMLAATASASNIYFWLHSGYFNSPTSQPLLHTWSLAVEEQFYISFPIFLVLVRRFFSRRLRVSVVALFFVSLVASAIVVSRRPETAFYMPYTRAWELLLGTILSLGMFPRVRSGWLRNLATIVGIGMIAFSVFVYTPATVFPGFSALVPCLGSALIIGAGEAGSSLVGAVLSWRPFVFIGLISYSLYLWHWPVIVLRKMGMLIGAGAIASHRYARLLPTHRFDMLEEIALSLLLGVLSWRFVERPFRSGPLRLSGRPLFALAGTVMFLLLGFSSWTVFAGGFKGRFPADAVQIAADLDSDQQIRSMRTGTCFITSEYPFEKYDYDVCLRQDSSKKNYLLLGDSHSAMLWSALSSALPDANIMQASCYGCEPSLHPTGSPDCRKMMAYIFQTYLPAHPVQGIFMAGRWSGGDMDGLTGAIAWAKQHQMPVTVFGPMPEYDASLPRLLAYSIAWKQPGLASQHRVAAARSLDAEMQSLATNTWHVPYISLYQEICGADVCAEYADAAHKIPLMFDTDHLTRFGASFVVQRLVEKGELH